MRVTKRFRKNCEINEVRKAAWSVANATNGSRSPDW
jgi:hypothetical protein